MIKVGIVDDHPVTLWGLRSALETSAEIDIVAVGAEPAAVDPAQIDVLVLDVYLASDFPCVSVVAEMSARTSVVVTSASDDAHAIAQCMAAGASAYLHKGSPPELFVDTVKLVAAGGSVPLSMDPIEQPPLSPREHAVLAQIAEGLTHDQIARRLGISKHTVDTYIKRVRAKLSLGNKADLTRAALAITQPARLRV